MWSRTFSANKSKKPTWKERKTDTNAEILKKVVGKNESLVVIVGPRNCCATCVIYGKLLLYKLLGTKALSVSIGERSRRICAYLQVGASLGVTVDETY